MSLYREIYEKSNSGVKSLLLNMCGIQTKETKWDELTEETQKKIESLLYLYATSEEKMQYSLVAPQWN